MAAGLLAASTLGIAMPAAASTPDSSDEHDAVAFFEANMARFDVPQELRTNLLEKAVRGERLDADLAGAVPVSVEMVTNEYGTFPVSRFADGSFDSAGISEVVTGDVDPSARGVQNCFESGSDAGQQGRCQAYHWTFWHNMYFMFQYEWQSGGSSRILSMYDQGFDSGNSCETEEFGITQAIGSSGNPARGDWIMACTDLVGASSSKSLGVRVIPDQVVYTVQNY